MKKSKICPKCSGTEIFSNEKISKSGDRSVIPVSNFKSIYVQTYICVSCGYLEEYVDVKDKSGLEKLVSNWKQVN